MSSLHMPSSLASMFHNYNPISAYLFNSSLSLLPPIVLTWPNLDLGEIHSSAYFVTDTWTVDSGWKNNLGYWSQFKFMTSHAFSPAILSHFTQTFTFSCSWMIISHFLLSSQISNSSCLISLLENVLLISLRESKKPKESFHKPTRMCAHTLCLSSGYYGKAGCGQTSLFYVLPDFLKWELAWLRKRESWISENANNM